MSFLCGFNILQFLLLSGSNVVFLSDGFFSQEFIEFASGLLCFLVVSLDFTFLSVFFKKSKEIQNFVIGRNIYDSVVTGLSYKFLSIEIIWIVLGQFIFNLLHQLNEIVKRDAIHVWFNRLLIFTFWSSLCFLPDCKQKIFCFLRVSLQTLHNGLQIGQSDFTFMVFIKQIKYFFQVLNFFIGKPQIALLLSTVVILILLLIWVCSIEIFLVGFSSLIWELRHIARCYQLLIFLVHFFK